MDESNQSKGKGLGANAQNVGKSKGKSTSSKQEAKNEGSANSNDQEVLFNLPAGLKYKLPGKRQRVVLGTIVIALNALLVLAVLLYFYNPSFQDFIYNVGRE